MYLMILRSKRMRDLALLSERRRITRRSQLAKDRRTVSALCTQVTRAAKAKVNGAASPTAIAIKLERQASFAKESMQWLHALGYRALVKQCVVARRCQF
jgi:hypothetical protein